MPQSQLQTFGSLAAASIKPQRAKVAGALLLVFLSGLHGLVLYFAPPFWVIAILLWWNANTISHFLVHRKFFHTSTLNHIFSLWETLILGYPQNLWSQRHLAHHAGRKPSIRFSQEFFYQSFSLLALWSMFLYLFPTWFIFSYIPGLVLGQCLCYLHGHFEHHLGVTSHYGKLYNVLFFNDGFHVEHHRFPARQWNELPTFSIATCKKSRWPAILRWMDFLSLDSLERFTLSWPAVQRWLVRTHERAFLKVLGPKVDSFRNILIVGGGLFPRSALILKKLCPDAKLVVVDSNQPHIDIAKAMIAKTMYPDLSDVEFRNEVFDPSKHSGNDLIVVPLAFIGDKREIYQTRSSILLHDWMWNRAKNSTIVSLLLLKRVALVEPCGG